MATTTNFGWETPDDTDLVKDGALAMRTLGNAIDTSLVDLKGGTTGQVLSKNSNTDMDFVWVTSDDANAIQNAIVDAKGDLITATAADTPARLAVGSNGDTLVADSAASTGLRWTATPSASNPLINSDYSIWQRGTSLSINQTPSYTADRWFSATPLSGAGTVSRQTTSDTTNLPNIQYCARVQRNSGNSVTGIHYFCQPIETVNSIPFVGKTVTLSFYARKGADYSPTSSLLIARLISGTGTDQNYLNTWSGSATVATLDATLTTTWQRFTATGTVGTTATQLVANFGLNAVGTAGAADYFEITGVQIDVGNVALPFRRSGGTIQGELAACQRYYYENTKQANAGFCMGQAYSTTQAVCTYIYPVTMRATPTVSVSAAGDFDVFNASASRLAVTAFSAQDITNENFQAILTVASGLVAGNGTGLASDSGGAAAIKVSAEL